MDDRQWPIATLPGGQTIVWNLFRLSLWHQGTHLSRAMAVQVLAAISPKPEQ
jgi:hypothetical protein